MREAGGALALAMALVSGTAALAEIRIVDARIAGGELRVTGIVAPRSDTVIMDDDVSVQTDARGRFAFRSPTFPKNCTVTLKAGQEQRAVVIANCGATGPQGAAGPAGPAGPPGPAGEAGARGEAAAAALTLRPVVQACSTGSACEAACDADEIALAATCSDGTGAAVTDAGATCRSPGENASLRLVYARH